MSTEIAKKKVHPNTLPAISHSQDMSAQMTERAGARAMMGEARPMPTPSTYQAHPLPKFRNAPKGSVVIDRSGGYAVALVYEGQYLGLHAVD